MEILEIDILGIIDLRWPNFGQVSTTSGTIDFSGNNEADHKNRVAVLVSKNFKS